MPELSADLTSASLNVCKSVTELTYSVAPATTGILIFVGIEYTFPSLSVYAFIIFSNNKSFFVYSAMTSLISSNNPCSRYDSDIPSSKIISGPLPAIISVFKVLKASDSVTASSPEIPVSSLTYISGFAF